jgi:hypothetical protein
VKDGQDGMDFAILHYGFIREPKAFIKKAREYETLSNGETNITDEFKPEKLYTLNDTDEYKGKHPVEIQDWLTERFGYA